jgi:hypothetical protein
MNSFFSNICGKVPVVGYNKAEYLPNKHLFAKPIEDKTAGTGLAIFMQYCNWCKPLLHLGQAS